MAPEKTDNTIWCDEAGCPAHECVACKAGRRTTYTAWELIGFDGTTECIDRNLLNTDTSYPGYEARSAHVRIKGGRRWYEAVDYNAARNGRTVKLAWLDESNGLRTVVRYVDPDTKLEVIEI